MTRFEKLVRSGASDSVPRFRVKVKKKADLMNTSKNRDWLKVSEAAKLLGIEPCTLYGIIRSGKFPSEAVSKRPGLSMRVNLARAIPERFGNDEH